MRRRLTYANVMATVAMFLALGGAGYAASQLPAHSVGTRQLKSNAVTSSKVKNHSLRTLDFARGQVPTGPTGPAGAAGRDGAAGSAGAPGPPGPTAAGFAHISGGSPLSTAVLTVVGDTSSSPSNSGPITTTFAGRFVVTASVELYKASADAANEGSGECFIQVGSGGTFTNTGGYGRTTLPAVTAGEVAAETIGLTSVTDEPPGTYDARVRCGQRSDPGATAAVYTDHTDISVVVAGQPGS